MAIEFARLRYVKRSDGGNACRSAAYNSRADIKCARTNERFYFAHREPSLHHTVLLPEGADEKFRDVSVLWNEAQAMEKRKDSQEAKEVLLAMPTDAGLDLEDWKKMAEEFAHENFVSKGVAVQLDIHTPHKGEINVHAHLLITTRRIEGDHFASAKARDLDPEIRTMKGGQKAVTEADRWGILWRDYQNLYFEREGLDIRVDEVGAYAQKHEGPVRMRTNPEQADARAETTRTANELAARDPEKVLETLTRRRATFTEMDIERIIRKHVESVSERAEIRLQVLKRPEVVALHERENGKFTGIYTTKEVRLQERQIVAYANVIAEDRKAVNENKAQKIAKENTLDGEQLQAFAKATGTDGLVIIEGLAGTGKSHSLNAIREAHEKSGWKVVGLAPTNTAADELRRAGFKRAGTVHLELFYQSSERHDRSPHWDRHTVVMVDEAAMLDTRTYARLMSHAAVTGAKVILAGDDRQLASVERGGMFTVLKQEHGSVVISKVRRQEVEWQRTASEDFSAGRVAEGLRAYAERGHVHWSKTIDESRTRLISDWDQDSRENPATNRFVYAGTNAEVNQLNKELRSIRVKRGEVSNDLEVETVRGKLVIGKNDRVQFHGNDRRAGIYNGALATIENIRGTEVRARTDAGRTVEWDTARFNEYALGYAGTVYRGQGKTQTDVYALYDNSAAWNARTAYVGLTRHRSDVELYVSNDLAENEVDLSKKMARRFREEASLAWATREEVKEKIQEKKQEKTRDTVANDQPGGEAVQKQPAKERFPREEVDVMRRMDMTAYARDVHGYEIKPDLSGDPNRFVIVKSNNKGEIEKLEVRRATDGHWTFRDPADRLRRGDIFDLAVKEGSPDFKTAREQVSAYYRNKPLDEKQDKAEENTLVFVKDQNLSVSLTQEGNPDLESTNKDELVFVKDQNKSVSLSQKEEPGQDIADADKDSLTFVKDQKKSPERKDKEKDKGDDDELTFAKDKDPDNDRSR